MKCPKCQFEIPEDFHFCGKCGCQLSTPSNLPVTEQSLKTKLERIQRYLPKALVEKILSQRDEIEGERRQLTIMFCDIKESMPLIEKLGEEKTFSFLDQFFEILFHKTNVYEGTVIESRGDSILALFGWPYAIENAPHHAVQSALAIHREIARFNKEDGCHSGFPLILLRIGISTGSVVVGSVGNERRLQFTAVGDTTNMAARMEQMAEPGTTYVTEDTFRQTKELFQFKSLGKRRVKGKEKPLAIYKVLSGKKNVYRPRLGLERTIYSKMVGRDNELNRLAEQVMKAINGKGSVVSIIGEAGIGKSRLIAELKKLEVVDQVTFIEGRAISIGKNLSYHPIIDFLKQWAQINTDDGEEKAIDKLEHAVRSVCSEDSYEVLPFVATLMGMTLSGRYAERIKGIEGEALEKLILKNVRELLIRASEIAPLVIVAEDLHWADKSSIELLEYLYRLVETQRIIFINVFRPGYEETSDRIVKAVREKPQVYNVEIVLAPMEEKTCRSFIGGILNLSYLHQNIYNRIISRAGGNPLFIEEILLSLIDEGVVALKDGSFEPTEKINTVAIPYTIYDVLMARIDRLDAETRNMLKSASVIGQEFFYRILSEVARTVENIDGRLSYLKEIQIIRERKRMSEVEYLFNHALVQEVVYNSILPIEKIKLHLKVAVSIEKVFGERLNEFYGMLAYHYGKADSPEKTEEYLINAGEEALKSSASNEALHYYQEALDTYLKNYGDTSDSEKIALLEKNIALALYNKGRHAEAVEYFDKALNYFWGKLPKHIISEVFRFLSGFFHFLLSLYLPFLKFRQNPTQSDNESVALFFKKLKTLAIINPNRFFIESFHFYKRVTKFDLSKFELGIGLFVGASTFFSFTGISFRLSRKILEFAKDRVDRGDIKSFTVYDFSETLHKYMEGNWKDINEYDDDLVNKNLSIGEIYWASQHFFWHGLPKLYQGYLDVPELFVKKLSELFDLYGNDLSMLLNYLLNTSLLMESHKLHEALIKIDEGIEFGQRRSHGTILIEMYSRKAHIHILMGDIELAEESLKLADKIRRETETVPWQLTDFFRGQFEHDLYRLKEFIRKGSKSGTAQYRKKANKSGRRLLKVTKKVAQYRTDSYKLRGVYYWLINEQKKAIKWWHRAVEEGERLDARLELSRTYFEVGKRLLEEKSEYRMFDGIKAEDYLEKARVLFEQMDLQWDLDELDQVKRG